MRKLIVYPDPLLKRVSTPIERFDKNLRLLYEDMNKIMKAFGGFGLAAIQVGVPKQAILVDETFLINPRIIWDSGEVEILIEACLSFPGIWLKVPRYKEVEVEYQDFSGDTHRSIAKGLRAQCIQHEIDHTLGQIFVDKAIGEL